MRRAVLGGLAGAILGGALGLAWFSLYGSDAEWFGGITSALSGGVALALAGGSWGWGLTYWRAASMLWRILSVLAWVACGTLLVVGIVYIGGWTNADGPDAEAMIGILGIPASFGGVWLIGRSLRRRVGRA